MNRTANPALDQLILQHLSDKYKLLYHRGADDIHLSSVVYCLTKAFWEARSPSDPTEEELLLFAVGYALQDVLTPKNTTTPTLSRDRIIYRPDFMLELSGVTVELKTTRVSLKKNLVQLPETWIEYIMGGCYILGINIYSICSLHLMGDYAPPFPKIYSEQLEFEPVELDENWHRLIERRSVLELAFIQNKPPTPYIYCKDWECKNCRYKLLCDAVQYQTKEN